MVDRIPTPLITSAMEAEKPILRRLLQLYLHDFSEFADAAGPFGNIDDDGTFQYKHLDDYWKDVDREALLFRVDNRLAGFALLNRWSASGLDTDKAIAEFFILRKYRRTGLGTLAALQIIQRQRVTWEIAVTDYNLPACRFWQSVVQSATGYVHQEFEGDGKRWSGTIWRMIPRQRSR